MALLNFMHHKSPLSIPNLFVMRSQPYIFKDVEGGGLGRHAVAKAAREPFDAAAMLCLQDPYPVKLGQHNWVLPEQLASHASHRSVRFSPSAAS